MIYVVLGMHKSGTTLVSQILHHSGVDMGDFDTAVSYDQGNQYERESTQDVNQTVLGSFGKESLDVSAPRQPLRVNTAVREEMQRIVAKNEARHEHWGFKDPRSCFTYPLWESVLPDHKLIVVYRPVEEMWKRYRSDKRAVKNPYRAWRLVMRWSESNVHIANYLSQTTRPYFILNYPELMNGDAAFEALQAFVGLPLNDRRRPSLYRGEQKKYAVLEMAKTMARLVKGYDAVRIIEQIEAHRLG